MSGVFQYSAGLPKVSNPRKPLGAIGSERTRTYDRCFVPEFNQVQYMTRKECEAKRDPPLLYFPEYPDGPPTAATALSKTTDVSEINYGTNTIANIGKEIRWRWNGFQSKFGLNEEENSIEPALEPTAPAPPPGFDRLFAEYYITKTVDRVYVEQKLITFFIEKTYPNIVLPSLNCFVVYVWNPFGDQYEVEIISEGIEPNARYACTFIPDTPGIFEACVFLGIQGLMPIPGSPMRFFVTGLRVDPAQDVWISGNKLLERDCRAWGIAFDQFTQKTFLVDRLSHKVRVFIRPESEIGQIGSGIFHYPSAVAVDEINMRVIVTDTGHHLVCIHSLSTATGYGLIKFFGGEGTENGKFSHPWGVAVSPNGKLIAVVDSGNQRVQIFDKDGCYVRKFSLTVTDDDDDCDDNNSDDDDNVSILHLWRTQDSTLSLSSSYSPRLETPTSTYYGLDSNTAGVTNLSSMPYLVNSVERIAEEIRSNGARQFAAIEYNIGGRDSDVESSVESTDGTDSLQSYDLVTISSPRELRGSSYSESVASDHPIIGGIRIHAWDILNQRTHTGAQRTGDITPDSILLGSDESSTVELVNDFRPRGVCFDSTGDYVFVSDMGNRTVFRFEISTSSTTVIAMLPPGTFCEPQGLGLNGAGNLAVCDSGNNSIFVINPRNGYILSTLQCDRHGVEGANAPMDVTRVRQNGIVYINSLGRTFMWEA